jgi:hypothetical protein
VPHLRHADQCSLAARASAGERLLVALVQTA